MLWIEYIILLISSKGDFLFYLTEALKSILIFIFIDMTIKITGWENLESSCYSEAKFESVLIRIIEFKGICSNTSLNNHEDVKWFILKVKIANVQYCIVSIGLLFVSIFLKYASGDNLQFGDISLNYGFIWLTIFKIFSSSLEILQFIVIGNCISEVGSVKSFRFKEKFRLFKYCLILTDLQPLIISILSKFTNIFGNSQSDSEKSTFIISIFYLVEIFSFLTASLNTFSTREFGITEKSDNTNNMTEISTIR